MATILCPARWEVVFMSTPKYHVVRTTQCWVMANVNYIMWPWPLTYFPKKWGHLTGSSCWMYVPNLKFIDLIVFEICGHKMQILWLRCYATGVTMATILCPTSWGVILMLTLKYEVDRTTQYWVITLRDLDLVMPLGWSAPVPLNYNNNHWDVNVGISGGRTCVSGNWTLII